MDSPPSGQIQLHSLIIGQHPKSGHFHHKQAVVMILFGNHEVFESSPEPTIASNFPSPSISASATLFAPQAHSENRHTFHVPFPKFRCHITTSSKKPALRTSSFPSPSMSLRNYVTFLIGDIWGYPTAIPFGPSFSLELII